MSRLLISCLVAAMPAVAQDTPPPPKQALKAELTVQQEGRGPVTLPAKRPEMAARANMWTQEKFWRFLFASAQPEVGQGAFTFTAAVDPNDLPGGGFYLCSMKKDDDKVFFNVSSDAAGAPKNDFVVLKPSDLPSTKNPDGTYTFKVSKPLKAGPYALYTSDNQYAWPFVVK
jgi:hypothetical protein